MKKNFFLWLRRWQFPLLLLLSVMPLILTTLCLNAPETLAPAGWLYAAYAAASALCLLCSGPHRLWAAACSSAAMFALSLLVLPVREMPLLLLLPAALCALLFYSLPLAMRKYESDIPPYIYFAGVGIHIVIQFLHHYFSSFDGQSPYAPIETALTGSLIGYMLLFLLSMNRISLDNASLARHRIPSGMRIMNTAMTMVFLVASLILAVTPAIIRGITALWQGLLSIVRRFLAWLISLLPAETTPGFGAQGGMDNMLLMGGETPAPSALAVLLEKIAAVFSFILFIIGIVFLLHSLFKLTIRLIRRMAAQLRSYMSAASGEFEDEITDTREDGAQREIRFLRKGKRSAAQSPDTPVGHIRFAYARLLRRRPQWTPSSTARENLSVSAAEIYERARYSSHPVTKDDVQRFNEQIRTEKKG